MRSLIRLTSSDFKEGGDLSQRFTCEGEKYQLQEAI